MWRWFKVILTSLVVLVILPLVVLAQDESQYSYRFENPRFEVSLVEITIAHSGQASFHYKKRDSGEEDTLQLQVLPKTIETLQSLYTEIRFLDSTDSYQTNNNFQNLGTTTIGLKMGKRERQASFNYTSNRGVMRLTDLFRAFQNQQLNVIDIRLARQFTPLDLPKQLKLLEENVKKERIAEPSQLLPLLGEIAQDDGVPLIARNAATRLIMQIKKGK